MPSRQGLRDFVDILVILTCHSEGLPLFVTCIMTISFSMLSVISSCQKNCAFDDLRLSGLRQPNWLLTISSATSQGLAAIETDICVSL